MLNPNSAISWLNTVTIDEGQELTDDKKELTSNSKYSNSSVISMKWKKWSVQSDCLATLHCLDHIHRNPKVSLRKPRKQLSLGQRSFISFQSEFLE